jgi:ABC-2 type transport system ATP-binding protein
MIEVHDLTRRYGEFVAVDTVNFTVAESEIVGILGPNGAGKTTTIRMITGFLPPSGGKVLVNGKNLALDTVGARREIGYLPENIALYPEMRVSEYLSYRARLEGLGRSQARSQIGVAVERCLLADVRDQIIGTLSKGYRQRVGLATAILHEPSVLVLDEPTVGLDPKQIVAIRELIRELGKERTLLLSTHILPEVELLCDRVVIIDGGRIVAQGTPQDLRESWTGNTRIRVAIEKPAETARETLERVDGVLSAEPNGAAAFVLECEGNADPRAEIFRTAIANGWTLLELSQSRASLEDIFVRLTTRDAVISPVSDTARTEQEALQ